MIKIAICDDEEEFIKRNQNLVNDCAKACKVVTQVTCYSSGTALVSDIQDDNYFYDLFLLDIEMPDISGMEIAAQVKTYLPDIKIIFITSHNEYAIDAFELSIFRYVPKEDLDFRLMKAITDAIHLIAIEADQYYVAATAYQMERIPFRDILYMQREGKGKNVIITTFTKRVCVRKSLQKVLEELGTEEFVFIDRGCIVNLIHICQLKNSMVFMKNKESLPVSRSRLQELKLIMNTYWGKHV